jgi:oxygen-independent coproporphyrinogen-3 oxidase
MAPDQIAALLSVIHHNFPPTSDAEVSIEVNPSSATRRRFEAYRQSGINRLSIGVQSFDSTTLNFLGRPHSAEDAERTYHTARQAGFNNINLDLLFGLPFQDIIGWETTLEHALAMSPDHLSLYPLTLDDDTTLGKAAKAGTIPHQDPDLTADMYESAQRILGSAGYQHYEISNWTRPGRECRHNIVYWRNEPYLGFGAGAHSCLAGYRFSNEISPATSVA